MKTLEELEKLTDDELRVMLAECLGWKHVYIKRGSCGGAVFEWVWFHPWFPPEEQTADWIAENGRVNPPNFAGDLNQCQEIALTLDRDQRNAYINRIDEMVLNSMGDEEEDSVRRDFEWCCASARLRTLALILTLQKP